jgi:TPR repeat protein
MKNDDDKALIYFKKAAKLGDKDAHDWLNANEYD